ncbi:ABC-type Mn2+/Zn2+ transport system permease subunit [Actinoplanes abujensis]|uniref:ABC-type Mn2+/Zn2+ transport system permease subunit n=1 Tax=Paractinoplanes abujensis TaxID=882441 RepID=A0A7W7FYU3_9ACTN|nr:ABC-type Mn2+/Zn2+ transport system permease subunit [Actinoplanes abujensis]
MLLAAVCALVGVWVIARGMTFLGEAMSHGMLPGVALASILGVNLVAGAAVSALAMSAGVTALRGSREFGRDTSIGLLFVGMLAIGVIVVSHSRSFATDLTAFLFGDVLAIDHTDLLLLAATLIALAAVSAVFHRPFLALTFDPRKARTLGLRPALTNAVMMILLTVAMAVAFSVVGTLLAFGMLIAPSAAAMLVTRRLPAVMLTSFVIGSAATVAGLWLSWHAATAAGPTIAAVAVLIFFLLLAARRLTLSLRGPAAPPHRAPAAPPTRPPLRAAAVTVSPVQPPHRAAASLPPYADAAASPTALPCRDAAASPTALPRRDAAASPTALPCRDAAAAPTALPRHDAAAAAPTALPRHDAAAAPTPLPRHDAATVSPGSDSATASRRDAESGSVGEPAVSSRLDVAASGSPLRDAVASSGSQPVVLPRDFTDVPRPDPAAPLPPESHRSGPARSPRGDSPASLLREPAASSRPDRAAVPGSDPVVPLCRDTADVPRPGPAAPIRSGSAGLQEYDAVRSPGADSMASLLRARAASSHSESGRLGAA